MSEAAAETPEVGEPLPMPPAAPPAPEPDIEADDPESGEPIEVTCDSLKDAAGELIPLTVRGGDFDVAKFLVVQRRMQRKRFDAVFDGIGLLFDDASRDQVENAVMDGRLGVDGIYDVYLEGIKAKTARPTK